METEQRDSSMVTTSCHLIRLQIPRFGLRIANNFGLKSSITWLLTITNGTDGEILTMMMKLKVVATPEREMSGDARNQAIDNEQKVTQIFCRLHHCV